MKRRILSSLFLLPLLLTSCGQIEYPLEDYFLDMQYVDNFRVLQLTDIHFGVTTNYVEQKKHLDTLVEAANPNLIVITGDTFMDATTREVDYIYSYFDSLNIPWTIVWGNHDRQGWYAPSYILNQLEECQNVLFKNLRNDNVYGDSNFVINIKQGNETLWRMVMIDSNSYYDDGSLMYKYDVIHEDQIAWYKKIINYGTETIIPSLMFMHIQLDELYLAVQELEENPNAYEYIGEIREDVYPGYTNTGMFDAIKECGSTKGVFFGHYHINTLAVDYQDVILAYGIKSTNKIYHDEDLIGGQVITLPSDGSFSLANIERIFVPYEK